MKESARDSDILIIAHDWGLPDLSPPTFPSHLTQSLGHTQPLKSAFVPTSGLRTTPGEAGLGR